MGESEDGYQLSGRARKRIKKTVKAKGAPRKPRKNQTPAAPPVECHDDCYEESAPPQPSVGNIVTICDLLITAALAAATIAFLIYKAKH